MKSNIIKISILFILSLVQNLTIAQSTDPDKPTALSEGQLTIAASSERQSYYYTVTASGGDIKLTGDGLGKFSFFEIFVQDEDFKTIKSSNFAAKTPLERTVFRVNIKQAQKLILKITAPKENNTSLKLRIEGAVSFDANGSNNSTTTDNSQSTNNASISSTTSTQTNGDNSATTTQDSIQQSNSNSGTNSNNTNNDNSQSNTSQQNTEGGVASTVILITLKSGTTTEGVYNEYNIDNSDPKKLVLTLRGKNVPDLSTDMASSIEIFGRTREASAESKEENKPTINLNGSPMGTSGQFMLNKKIVVKTQTGQFINGTYSGYSYSFNSFKNKYTITLRGKNLPKFEVADVKSIQLER